MNQVDEEVAFKIPSLTEDSSQETTLPSDESTLSPVQTQSQSIFTGLLTPVNGASTSDREDRVRDRFNGILYHVIPSEGQITILFSSKELYNKFIDSIEKELHAKSISKTRSNYTTHIRGRWCSLTTDSNAASICATGPGHMLWRETVFTRLAIRLYQQFTNETNEDINTTLQSQTSTPSSAEHHVPSSLPVSPVETQESTSGVQQQSSPISVISRQVAELHQVSKHLQDQLLIINSKIDVLLQRHREEVSAEPEINEISETTLEEESKFITLSETTEDPKLTPGSAAYSEVLARDLAQSDIRIPADTMTKNKLSEEKTEKRRSQKGNSKQKSAKPGKQSTNTNVPDKTYQSQTSKQQNGHEQGRTLIIGDSIVSGINRKGLKNRVECHPVPGATIDAINNKLQIFDISKFDNIVVYVGGNDTSRNTNLEYFEEKYDQLITSVKSKNSSCQLFLCTSCPRGDTEVMDINEVIMRLCETNKLTCIDTNSAFYDRKDQLRDHFYKPRDNIHLSRSGIKRLLGTIDQHLGVVDNFEKCVYPPSQSSRWNPVSQYKPRRTATSYAQQSTQDSRRSANQDFSHSRTTKQREEQWMTTRHQHTSEKSHEECCMKCGMSNHTTAACRHQKQVQCFRCKFFGHKDSSGLCWNF